MFDARGAELGRGEKMESYSFKNVDFTYPEGEKKALRGICFTVQQGEFVILCGPSGCGKSTLLKSLNGYTEVDYVHLSIPGATDAELNEIESLLKGGVLI